MVVDRLLASMTAAMLIAMWAAVRSFGSRATYVAALAAFSVATILGALSPNESTLIIARVIYGAAAGLAQPLGMVAIFQIVPANRRGTAMGIYGLGVILAPALGPCEPFDWIGFILLCLGLSVFWAALSNGQRLGWDSVFVLGAWVLAAFCLTGFLWQENRSPTPILALEVYRNPLSGRLSDHIAPHLLIFWGLVIFGVSNILMSEVGISTDF